MEEFSRCPNCNGEKKFNPKSGMLVCERCGSTFPVAVNGAKPVRRMYSPTYSYEDLAEKSVQYECATCGAKSVVGTNGEVKRCVSCGNTTLKKVVSNINSPDGIIPFKISRQEAAGIFRKWVAGRKFAPSDLKQMARLEKISGLYTPVWNFNFIALCRYKAIGVKKKMTEENHEYFMRRPVEDVQEKVYANITSSGSSKISNEFITGLGEFDYTALVPYSTDYLLGFAGLQTDIDVHKTYEDLTSDIIEDNKRRAKSKLEGEYDYVEDFSCNTRFRDVAFNYSYVPIWANHYTYKGKRYHCYINGQNGTATGSAPKSFWKLGGLVLGILGGIAAIIAAIALLT